MSENHAVEIIEIVPDASDILDDVHKMSVSTVAPVLRVEQIKDLEGHNNACTSEDEGLSQGEGSDAEAAGLSAPIEEFVAPNDELRDKIIKQAEFYFSDVNILKDAFLLKHVRRNKQGFVSLKLITSFKKMKSLTKDYRVVAFSLKQSANLQVNEEGTKVRRKEPLPEYDETTPSRTVVAVNLPIENPTVENVAEMFSKSGDVSLIRILKPGKPIPADIKKHSFKHPEIGTAICAVIEFESHEHAKKTCETMTNNDDWRGGLRVVLLAMGTRKNNKDGKDNDKLLKATDNKAGGDMRSDANGSDVEQVTNEKKKKTRRGGRKKNNRLDELSHDSSCYSSGSEAEGSDSLNWRTAKPRPSLSPPGADRNHLSPNITPKASPNPSPHSSPRARRRGSAHGKSPLADNSPSPSPQNSPGSRRKKYDYSSGDSTPSSPWVQRRLKAAQELSPLTKDSISPGASPLLARRNPDGSLVQGSNLIGVIRIPKGPDGTRGFHNGVGRGKPRSDSL